MMGHNSTLWRPDADTRAKIRKGEQRIRELGGPTSGMTEKAAAARGRQRSIDEAATEADKRMGQPHYGH